MNKKIGEGLQYNVYDIYNGRVSKITTSTFEKINTLKRWGNYDLSKIKKKIKSINKITPKSIKGVKSIPNFNFNLIGNPFFKEKLNYEQDKVILLGKYFSAHSLQENKNIIDLYIKNIFVLWKFGVSDTVFNFTINNGVNKNGEVILSDIGELTFVKKDVAGYIKEKKWLKKWSLKDDISDLKLKSYIAKKFDEKLTLENLEKYWKNLN